MSMKKTKSEKGSISVYAIATVLGFVIILGSVFLSSSVIRKEQLRTLYKIKEIYAKETVDNRNALEMGLQVGSEVAYNPNGTYNWQATYCSSTKTPGTDDVLLESKTGKSFNISSWRVLSINEYTGMVELVPNAPTTGVVYLGEAQGYNNGVKLLNDACSSLYGNTTKGITARSINIEDIERYMKPEKLTEAYNYIDTDSNTKYGNQVGSPYTSDKNYPIIYAQEKLSVINGTKKEDGLGLSDSTKKFIERTEGTTSATIPGAITTATSIQPYQTYWYKDSSYMSTAFKDYTKKDRTTDNYYDLIMPNGASTTYWVASRCVNAYSRNCTFYVRYVNSGYIDGYYMYNSYNNTKYNSIGLFPVVTLSYELIEGNATSGFSVK